MDGAKYNTDTLAMLGLKQKCWEILINLICSPYGSLIILKFFHREKSYCNRKLKVRMNLFKVFLVEHHDEI